MLKKLVTHKSKGQGFGELFSSLLAILALCVVVLFFIGTISVLNRQVNMDNTIRGFMLQMESQGYLTTVQQDELRTELTNLGAYNGAYTIGDNTYNYDIKLEGWDPVARAWSEQALGTAAGYGNRVGLKVTMTVPDNEYHPVYWLGQIIQQKLRVREAVITKVSTAKY